ncbi:class I SAM-dependent methyltransferase [Candidatus Micrarchaeota archaeon]|nr:class I SAM-dependent methyltransferase [Candidatus Micrarchaeota archaeon]MBU1930079.1 class I SAM-dependent methyltransferase [Candidatus Micrarchaeota archaeon]
MELVERYKKKYAIGLVDVNNSLSTYNKFLHNIGVESSLEEIVLQIIKRKKKVRILDIGCGNAGVLCDLKNLFKDRVETIGMDLIAFSPQNADRSIIGNALQKRFPAQCDLVFSFRSLHEIGLASILVSKVCNGLAPKGMAFLAFRLHSIVNDKVEWSGAMHEKDEQFLFDISQLKSFQRCKVSGKLSREELSSGEKVVTGILIKITKEDSK